jgi:hypothetical protein
MPKSICVEDDCTEPAVAGWGTLWCTKHDEDHEVEYGHTDTVQQIAADAAEGRLQHYTSREDPGDLVCIDAARASYIATTSALQALDAAGHLVPEGATVTKQWQAVTDDGASLTAPMDDGAFEQWMKTRGLRTGEHVVTLRTISTPVPRELVVPVLQPAAVGEGAF